MVDHVAQQKLWSGAQAKLFLAAKTGRIKILKELESSGFDPMPDPFGNSLAHWAVLGGHTKVLRHLGEHSPQLLWAKNIAGQQPLHLACITGKFKCAVFLLLHTPDIEISESRGCSSLLLAAENGHAEIAAVLLLLSADIKATDVDENTAYHLAAKKGHINVCNLLKKFGIKPWLITNYLNQTPLHVASMGGHLNVVRSFCRLPTALENQLVQTPILHPLYIRDKEGLTPMQLADRHGWLEVVALLSDEKIRFDSIGLEHPNFQYLKRNLINAVLGKPGRRKFAALYFHACTWLGIYPFLWFQMLNSSFNFTGKESCKWWLSLNIPAWICYLGSTYVDPGFIQRNTQNYETAFLEAKRIILSLPRRMISVHSSGPTSLSKANECVPEAIYSLGTATGLEEYKSDVNKLKQILTSLCHSCGCIKPLRTKHCAQCDRCVEVFDHHCSITNNCVGKRNRVWFLGFSGMVLLLSSWIGFLAWDSRHSVVKGGWHYNALFLIAVVSGWTFSLGTFSNAVQYAITNLTTNETINWIRYEYLHKKRSKGFHNPFDRGILRNLISYFGFGPELENYMMFTTAIETKIGRKMNIAIKKQDSACDPCMV